MASDTVKLRAMSPTTLRREMQKRGLSQDAFAQKLGVDPTAVSRWLSGQRPIPAYIAKLVDLLPKEKA